MWLPRFVKLIAPDSQIKSFKGQRRDNKVNVAKRKKKLLPGYQSSNMAYRLDILSLTFVYFCKSGLEKKIENTYYEFYYCDFTACTAHVAKKRTPCRKMQQIQPNLSKFKVG